MPVIKTREEVIFKGTTLRHANLTWSQSGNDGVAEGLAIGFGHGNWGGSVDIISPDQPTNTSPYPGRLYPRSGDKLTIRIYYNEVLVKTFYPVVDAVQYTKEGVTLELISPIDKFSEVKVRLPPLLQQHPRTLDATAFSLNQYRYPRPTPIWPVAEAFRAADYNLTPLISPSQTIIDVSMQGAVWANHWKALGNIQQVQVHTSELPGRPPVLVAADGRMYMHNGVVFVAPQRAMNRGEVRLSFLARRSNWAGPASFALHIDGAATAHVVLTINRARELQLTIGGTQVASTSVSAWAADQVVSLVIAGGQYSLATESTIKTGPATFPGTFTGLRITAHPEAYIAGVQVEKPRGLVHRNLDFKQSAFIYPGRFVEQMKALPSVRDQTARALLDEIAAQTGSTWWLDGESAAHFEGADVITSRSVSHELTALNDISDYRVEDSLLLKRSEVTVEYAETAISRANDYSINLWSQGGSIKAGDESQEFMEVPSDAEFIDPDMGFERGGEDMAKFNTSIGSWYGLSTTKDWATGTIWGTGYTFTSRQITPWVFLFTDSATEDSARTVPEDTRVAPWLRGLDLPMFRGRGKVSRVPATAISQVPGAPGAPGLALEATRWIDDVEKAQALADWVASQLADPLPALRAMAVRYSPKITLFQTIRVFGMAKDETNQLFGAILRVLVVGFKHSPDTGKTALDVRVIAEEQRAFTWADAEAAVEAAGITWTELEAANAAATWAQAEANAEKYLGG